MSYWPTNNSNCLSVSVQLSGLCVVPWKDEMFCWLADEQLWVFFGFPSCVDLHWHSGLAGKTNTIHASICYCHPWAAVLQSQLQGLIPGLLVTDQQGSEQSDSGVLCWGIWYYKVFQIRRVPIITNVLTSNKCTEFAHCLNSTVCGEASAGSWRKLSSVILMGNRWSVTGGCSVISLNR